MKSIPYLSLQCCWLCWALFLPVMVPAQSLPVHFQVDMQFADLKPEDKVILRGSGPTLGNWLGADVVLETAGKIHQKTVFFPDDESGDTLRYKYVILRATGEEQGESIAAREFIAAPGALNGPPVLFNELDRPMLSSPITLDIAIDLEEARFNGERPAGVGISGGPLGKAVPALNLEDENEDGIWEGSIEFDPLMPADVLFGFYFLVDGRWIEEPGGLKHFVFLSGDRPRMKMAYDGVAGRLVSKSEDLLVDRFDEIAEAMGEAGSKSIYSLYAALDKLQSGDFPSATGYFEKFSNLYKGDLTFIQDEFPLRYGYRLFAGNQAVQATNHLKSYESQSGSPPRKARFGHAIGAGWAGIGQNEESLEAFQHVVDSYLEEKEFAASSLIGKAQAYIAVDSLRFAGIAILDSLLQSGEHEAGHWKLRILQVLAKAHRLNENHDAASELYESLTDFGTNEWQIKFRIKAIENSLLAGNASSVLLQIESLLSENINQNPKEERLRQAAKNRHRTAHLLYLKASALNELNHTAEATQTLKHLADVYADTHFGRKAELRLK